MLEPRPFSAVGATALSVPGGKASRADGNERRPRISDSALSTASLPTPSSRPPSGSLLQARQGWGATSLETRPSNLISSADVTASNTPRPAPIMRSMSASASRTSGTSSDQLPPAGLTSSNSPQAAAKAGTKPPLQGAAATTPSPPMAAPAWTLDIIKHHIAQVQGVADAAAAAAEATDARPGTVTTQGGRPSPHPTASPQHSRPASALAGPGPAAVGGVTSVNEQVSAALAAWAKSGAGPGAPPDITSARAALLQLYSLRAGQVLLGLVSGKPISGVGAAGTTPRGAGDTAGAGTAGRLSGAWAEVTGVAADGQQPDGLAAALVQLQQLVGKAGAADVEGLVAVAVAAQQEASEAKTRLAYAQEDNTLLRNTLAQLRNTGAVASPSPTPDGSRELNTQLRATISDLRQHLVDMKQKAQDANAKASATQSQLDAAKQAAAASATDAASTRRQLQALRCQADEALALRQQSERECVSVCGEVKSWQLKCERLEAQLAQTKAHSDSLVSALTCTSDTKLKELQAEQQRNEALQLQVDQLQQQLSQQDSASTTWQQQLAEHQAQAHHLEADLRAQATAAQGQLQSARALSERQQEVMGRWEVQIKELQEQATRAQATTDAVTDQLNASRSETTRMAGDMHAARTQAAERDERVRALQAELQESRTTTSQLHKQIDTLSTQLTALTTQLQTAQSAVTTARSAHQEAVGQLVAVQGRAEEVQGRALDLESRVRALEDKVVEGSKALSWAQDQLLQAQKKAEQAGSDVASGRAALDAEWAEVAALKAALQQDSQTVKAMGTLVQARTLRFDINSLVSPDLGPSAENGQGHNRPVSAAHGDAGQARLANMVRELQAQLQACQVRLSQQALVATTAQQAAKVAETQQREAERKLSDAEARLITNDQARLWAEKSLREAEGQLSEAMQQLQDGQGEMRDVRRLLESAGRAGLTTEARVVLESQLVDARRAADDKARLAAALGDQVASLRQELIDLRSSTHTHTTAATSTSNAPTPTFTSTAARPGGRTSPDSPAHTAPTTPRAQQGGTAVTPAQDVSQATPVGVQRGSVAVGGGWSTAGQDEEDYSGLLAQLRKAHADLALLTDRLQDAERTIKRQDTLVTEMQARSHNSETQLSAILSATASASPRATHQPSDTSRPASGHVSNSGNVAFSGNQPTQAMMRSSLTQQPVGVEGHAAGQVLGSSNTATYRPMSALGQSMSALGQPLDISNGAGVLAANGSFRPLSAMAGPAPAGALRNRPWSAMPPKQQQQHPPQQQAYQQQHPYQQQEQQPQAYQQQQQQQQQQPYQQQLQAYAQQPYAPQGSPMSAIQSDNSCSGSSAPADSPQSSQSGATTTYPSGSSTPPQLSDRAGAPSSYETGVVCDTPQMTSASYTNGAGNGPYANGGVVYASSGSPRTGLPPSSPGSAVGARARQPSNGVAVGPDAASRPQSGATPTPAYRNAPQAAPAAAGHPTHATNHIHNGVISSRQVHAGHSNIGSPHRPMSAVGPTSTAGKLLTSSPVGQGKLVSSRPGSAMPPQRRTVLLLSASEPSAQAGLPSLAQATADAQRFLASWNNK